MLRAGFILFLAHSISGGVAPKPFDAAQLQDVFGTPAPQPAHDPVVDANGTLIDLDYWDADGFVPSTLDYDAFDLTLLKRVTSMTNSNVLLSPLSLKLALAILKEAATGPTASELEFVLGLDHDRNVVRTKFSGIIESLNIKRSTECVLNVGSSLYIEDSTTPRQKFAAIAKSFYKTDVKNINFADSVVAAKDINKWVADVTEGRIQNLVSPGDLTDVVAMIINSIFFKGSWLHQFPTNETKQGQFFVKADQAITVPFMRIKSKMFYSESTKLDAKILRMPYMGNKISMYIVVPNSITGLTRVLNGLNHRDLKMEMFYLQETLVDVSLPKFKFEFTSKLADVLRELGIRTAFEDTASFPGLARGQSLKKRLKVSQVLQRTGIEVNEVGSVAYAATAVLLVNKFGEDEDLIPREVRANKPFLYFIEDENTRQLLFTGRVSNPAEGDVSFKK